MRPGFYRNIWRFNAIVIAAIGVTGLIGVATVLILSLAGSTRREQFEDARALGPETAEKSSLVLSGGEAVDGTALRIFTLGRSRDNDGYGYSYTEGDDRNVLIVDQRDGTTRTVLADNSRRIIRWETLGDSTTGNARAYVALVRQSGDKDDDAKDLRADILVGNLRTGTQSWVVRNVRSIESPTLFDDNGIAFMTFDASGLTFHRIDLATLKPLVTAPIKVNGYAPQ